MTACPYCGQDHDSTTCSPQSLLADIPSLYRPHKCPCCDGWGRRFGAFGDMACPACKGTGLVWTPEVTP